MPSCEILTIGSELLNGSVLNTNAQYLARQVTALHIDVVHQSSCLDRESEIIGALDQAFQRSRLIIVTGGLGSTPDDVTRQAVARYFGCGLTYHRDQYRHIVKHFQASGCGAPPITRCEAYFPTVAKPLLNRAGIALGFYVLRSGRLLVVLPGVPRELVNIFERCVRRLIEKEVTDRPAWYWLTAKIIGLNEPQVMRQLGRKFFKRGEFEFGIYPEIGEVTIRIKSKQKRLNAGLGRELKERFGPRLFSFEEAPIASVIGRALRRRKLTLAVAESCTGGLFAKRLTDGAGASRYFKGGAVAYSDQIKREALGVSTALLARHGAVSREAARAMAQGVRTRYEASLGMSITGIAGPSGGSRRKPVGLVYISLADQNRTRTFECRFLGDRSKVRLQAAARAFEILWRWLAH